MKFLRARPWLLSTLALIVLCVLALLIGHQDSSVDVLFWIALVLVVTGGVLSELKYRRTLREQQR